MLSFQRMVCSVAGLACLASVAAAQLQPGDIVVTTYFGSLPQGVSRLNADGTLTPISVNGQFANFGTPNDLDIGPDGRIVVSVAQARLVAVNSTTGTQTSLGSVVQANEFLAGVTIGCDGNNYVNVRQFISTSQPTRGFVYRVPANGGTRSFISGQAPGFGPNALQFPNQSRLTPDGDMVIADLGDVNREDGLRTGRVVRIELQGTAGGTPNLGGQTLINPATIPTPGSNNFSASGIAVAPDGTVYVADVGTSTNLPDGGIYRIDSEAGTRQLIASGGDFTRLAYDINTNSLLAIHSIQNTVVRVDIESGAETVIFNANGTGGTVLALATFIPRGPIISSQPASVQACPGTDAVFSVQTAFNSSAYTYQWRRGGLPISGMSNPSAVTPTLTLPNIQPGADTTIDCVITNLCGSVTTSSVSLQVRSATDPVCTGQTCQPDANQDGVADQGDVDYLVDVIAGGQNPTGIDPDFNADGVADQGDVDALINVVAGGPCP